MKKSIGLSLALVAFLFSKALAVKPETMEDFGWWNYQVNSTHTFLPGRVNYATFTINGWILSSEVEVVGGTATYAFNYSTGYKVPPSTTTFTVIVSSDDYAASGVQRAFDFRGLVRNLKIIVKELSAGATFWARSEKLFTEND